MHLSDRRLVADTEGANTTDPAEEVLILPRVRPERSRKCSWVAIAGQKRFLRQMEQLQR
jgi:hypothetical protein